MDDTPVTWKVDEALHLIRESTIRIKVVEEEVRSLRNELRRAFDAIASITNG